MKARRSSPKYPYGKMSIDQRRAVKEFLAEHTKALVEEDPKLNNKTLAQIVRKETGLLVTRGNIGLLLAEIFGMRINAIKNAIHGKTNKRGRRPLATGHVVTKQPKDGFTASTGKTFANRLAELEAAVASLPAGSDESDNIAALFDSVNELNRRLTNLEKELGVS